MWTEKDPILGALCRLKRRVRWILGGILSIISSILFFATILGIFLGIPITIIMSGVRVLAGILRFPLPFTFWHIPAGVGLCILAGVINTFVDRGWRSLVGEPI